MNILTVNNTTYNVDNAPEEVDDIRFCVLDCSDQTFIDYHFLPLVFLESFYAPAVVLSIGENELAMPLDWSIMVCDDEMNEVEIMPLTSLNDRGFQAFVYNPLTDLTPTPNDITITDVYAEVKWFFPKLKNGNLLTIPLDTGNKPSCAYFVKEKTKMPKYIDIGDLF